MVESTCIPFLMPSMTETFAAKVMITTMRILFPMFIFTSSSRRCANLRMFSTPRPREVHTPKVVVTMDAASMRSPRGEYTRLPRRG